MPASIAKRILLFPDYHSKAFQNTWNTSIWSQVVTDGVALRSSLATGPCTPPTYHSLLLGRLISRKYHSCSTTSPFRGTIMIRRSLEYWIHTIILVPWWRAWIIHSWSRSMSRWFTSLFFLQVIYILIAIPWICYSMPTPPIIWRLILGIRRLTVLIHYASFLAVERYLLPIYCRQWL